MSLRKIVILLASYLSILIPGILFWPVVAEYLFRITGQDSSSILNPWADAFILVFTFVSVIGNVWFLVQFFHGRTRLWIFPISTFIVSALIVGLMFVDMNNFEGSEEYYNTPVTRVSLD